MLGNVFTMLEKFFRRVKNVFPYPKYGKYIVFACFLCREM